MGNAVYAGTYNELVQAIASARRRMKKRGKPFVWGTEITRQQFKELQPMFELEHGVKNASLEQMRVILGIKTLRLKQDAGGF